MSQSEDEILLFSNEKTIYRVAIASKIASWISLFIYLVSFINILVSIFSDVKDGLFQMPEQFMDILSMFANILNPLALGLFFFLTLQGIANGLYLLLDIVYEFTPEDEE